MRRTICLGLLGTLLGAATLSWLATVWTLRSSPAALEELPAGAEELASSPGEPQPVDALPPDAVKPAAAWQPLEVIDLLRPEETADLSRGEMVPSERGPESLSASGFVPAGSIRTGVEEAGFRWMSHCEAAEPFRVAPCAAPDTESDAGFGSSEEQEEADEPTIDSKAIEERLKHVVQSFLNNGERGPAAVDTLEFRPSDAKNGEFDRIPF